MTKDEINQVLNAMDGFYVGYANVSTPFPLVKDIVGYLKMCHSILPIKR